MCNCHSTVTENLKSHVQGQLPDGSIDLNISLNGYIFGIDSKNSMTHRAAMPVVVEYKQPKKTGGLKAVKKTINMRASFCPFCGVEYDKEEG